MKKELPIGAEDFINVKKNYYYVDKTPLLMEELAKAGDERVYLFLYSDQDKPGTAEQKLSLCAGADT